MGYCNILLTDATKKVCTTTTPLGKYEYNNLPMGVCIVPDIFQDRMSALTYTLDFSEFILTIFSSLNWAHSRST